MVWEGQMDYMGFQILSEKSSQVVRMPVLVSDNTENRCFLDTVFVRMLLPPLRKQVGFRYGFIVKSYDYGLALLIILKLSINMDVLKEGLLHFKA